MGYRFKLLAAGESSPYWKGRVKRLGLGSEVLLLGKLKRVEELYYASDALVYPSLFDASSNVVLEAMACGLPVITSPYSGTGELIEDGLSGFLISRPEDYRELASGMERVLNLSKEELEEIGARARSEAEKYPQEEVFRKYEEIIKRV
jgi:UDP-glucose:(heptosyl)LPS alpha-1,3-glucosyltransferase